MALFNSKILYAFLLLAVALFIASFVYIRFTGYGILGGDAVGGAVHLSWIDSSSNEDGFRIERSDNFSSFVEIDVVEAGVELYIDSAVTEGWTYSYRIRAYNSNGNSSYSNVVNVTVPLNGPAGTSSGGGGGGGGGSGGSSSGSGITGGVVLGNDSLGQGQQSSGEPSGESSSSLDSQNSGSSKISGRAIGEDLPLGKISIFGIIFIIVCLIVFILYKIFHHSSVMNVSNKKVAANI